MKYKDIPVFILLIFTLIYATIGKPDSSVWSGMYFISNYLVMFLLFLNEKNKINRITGISLSVSILVFIILKYLFDFECSRYYTFIPFTIALIAIYIKEIKR